MSEQNKVPVYNTLNDLPDELRAVVSVGGKPTVVQPTFYTKYMLVYGTLRWGCGNWLREFAGKTTHKATLRLQGFARQGLSCDYTGNPDHYTVFDLFEIEEDYFDQVNWSTDALEGISPDSRYYWGYNSTIVPLETDEGTILAKYYLVDRGGVENADKISSDEDYARSLYERWLANNETGKLEAWKKHAPKSCEFYSSLIDTYNNQKIEENEQTTIV
jgi:gamma-glutamylcyclotransferase (GGCT)/AIG2-like uncharacterized protein YtfP